MRPSMIAKRYLPRERAAHTGARGCLGPNEQLVTPGGFIRAGWTN